MFNCMCEQSLAHQNEKLQLEPTTVSILYTTEPVFLNVYGARESIQRNDFRQPM
jgi:hypothetical protein